MVLHAPIQVSTDALCVAVTLENLGEMHFALAAQPMWRDDEATRDYQRQAVGELSSLGLAGRGGLDRDFRDTLLALARPVGEFIALFVAEEQIVHAVAATAGGDGVLAVRYGDTVHLQPARRDLLAEAVVHQLPRVPAARGRAVNVPEQDVTPADTASRHRRLDEGFGGLRRPAENPDVAHLHRILEQPKVGGGQLFAGIRDRGGRPHSSPHPLSYMDTPEGRWMNQVTVTRTGEKWIIAAPANAELLVNRLYEMQRALA